MISQHRRAAWLGTISIASVAGFALAPLAHADAIPTAPGSTSDLEYEVELSAEDDLREDMYDGTHHPSGDAHDHDDDDDDVDDQDDDDHDGGGDHSSTTVPSSSSSSSTVPKSTTTTMAPTTTPTTAAPSTLGPTTTAGGGDLPATGGDASTIALLAGLGLVGGTLATVATRRRRSV